MPDPFPWAAPHARCFASPVPRVRRVVSSLTAALMLVACASAPPTAPTTVGSATPGSSASIGAEATSPLAASPEIAQTARPGDNGGRTPPASTTPPSSSPSVSPSPPPSPLPSPSEPPPSVLPSPTPVAAAPAAIDAALGARLQAVVDASRERIPSPGLSVAVRLPSGATWSGVSGFASLQPAEPVNSETVFAVASVSKTFVTALILQLADEGVLGLDDPLSRFVPDFPRARRISLRQLLSHTSGVFNFFEHPRYAREVFGDPSRRWTFEEILGLVAAPYCAPGACFHYSNTNFVLLGRVAEEATGIPLQRQIRERFLDPLGLEHTVFQPDEPTPRDAAHGHLGYPGGFIDHTGRSRVIPHLSAITVAWAAGAMASTPTDLARWADSLYGGEILSTELTAAMMAYRPLDEYGLGMRTRVFLGRRAVGHLGGIRGFENAMWHFPDSGVTIVVSANRGMFTTDRTMRLLVRTLFGS